MSVVYDVGDVRVAFPLHVRPPGVVGVKKNAGAHFGDLLPGVLEAVAKESCGVLVVGPLFVVPAEDEELASGSIRVHFGDYALEPKGPVGSLFGCRRL